MGSLRGGLGRLGLERQVSFGLCLMRRRLPLFGGGRREGLDDGFVGAAYGYVLGVAADDQGYAGRGWTRSRGGSSDSGWGIGFGVVGVGIELVRFSVRRFVGVHLEALGLKGSPAHLLRESSST